VCVCVCVGEREQEDSPTTTPNSTAERVCVWEVAVYHLLPVLLRLLLLQEREKIYLL
jgi:hypothetical protein